jgi:protein SCO1
MYVVGTNRMQKIFGAMLMSLLGCAMPLLAQQGAAAMIEDIGVDQRLGLNIPSGLTFNKEDGTPVKFEELCAGKVTLLVPVYYSCPSLCTTVLGSVNQIIDRVDFALGQDYQIVNVSFDPTNTPELAAAKAANYRSILEPSKRQGAEQAWFFLTGTPENITPLMDQIGFHYKLVDGEYSHAAALVVLTPDGKIARYLTGIGITPREARFAMLEAAEGKIGSPVDLVVSYCYRYDPMAGKYVPMAWMIMRVGCVLVLITMLIGGFFLWKSELVRKWRLEHNV